MKLLRNSSWLVYLALVTACGDDGPSSPTAPSPTSITVTGSDLLLVGNSDVFTAAGNTGALSLTAPRWGSDAPTVATVDVGTGRVTAVGTGTATIFVDANGIRGTKLISTLPNFRGEWNGRYELVDCQRNAKPSVCSWTEDTSNLRIFLTQNRDIVSSGSFEFGSTEDDESARHGVSGTVSPEGTLSLTGIPQPLTPSWPKLQNVRFESTQPGQLTGTFEEVWSLYTGDTIRYVFQLRDVYKK